ncbi:MAG: phosphoribosyltransferase family protein [Bacteroidota bacterium]
MKQLLHHLKYRNQEQIGGFLGEWYATLLENEDYLKTVDMVIPVPLHPKKKQKRGYNQVTLFAKHIAIAIQADYREDILIKKRNVKTQTKKDRQLRWENACDVFALADTLTSNPKHILLVDDVITTGATIEACAHTLLKIEGVEISVLSMAVVP